LSGTALEHLAHDDVLDFVRPDAGSLQCAFHRDSAELDAGLAGERTVDLGDRGARASEYDALRHE
jgi:hypothetical protein